MMNEKFKEMSPVEFQRKALEWGAQDPKGNAQIVKYGTLASLLVGTALIGPLAIIALAAKGGYDLMNEAENKAFEKFLAERLESDPGFVDELRDRAIHSIRS